MSVRIIVDSTCDLIPEIENRVKVVPMGITFGDEGFIDGVTISTTEFYDKLVNGGVLPTTSQPTPAAFADAYEEAVNEGDTVIAITVSAAFSGTYQSATIAAEDYPGKVLVVDSHSVALGVTVLTQYALKLVDEGKTAREIFDHLLAIRSRVRVTAVLDTLDYLHKGGRISKTVAIAGGLLSIKPIIAVQDGQLGMISKQANTIMGKEIDKMGGADLDMPIVFGYTGTSDELLGKYIAETGEYWGGRSFASTIVGSTVGTHAGPGAVAIGFFAKE